MFRLIACGFNRSLLNYVPHVLPCPTCLKSTTCTHASNASCLTCSRALLALCLTRSRASRASYLTCSCASRALRLKCFCALRASCTTCSRDLRAKWHMCYVATGGSEGPCSPRFYFRTKQGPTVSVSNIRDITFYGCLEIIRTKNFTIFTVYATIFGQFTTAFHFS